MLSGFVEWLMSHDDHELEQLVNRPPWMAQAACRGMPIRLFFLDRGDSTKEAKATCARCPVQSECLDYALEVGEKNMTGIWGGTSGRDRRLKKYPVAQKEAS
jgi:WhiB family transcriptional regulator, redox-sensing transcriptional regulator